MDIRNLRAFCVVAQEMHVTRAAKRLRIAQPALTQQIRSLEKSCGFSLLRANGRGIALTEAGAFFHTEAEAILVRLHDAELKAKEIARGGSGHLRVGVTEGASFHPTLAEVLSSVRAEAPTLHLTFSQKQTPDLANDLRTGAIDVAFMCPLPDPHGLTLHPLYAEDMLIAIPGAHRFARKREVSIAELKGEPLLLISHGNTEHSLESSLTSACLKVGFSPRILQTVPEFMLALNLVASGIGLTFVPPYMQGIHPQSICYRPLREHAVLVMETVVAHCNGSVPASVFALSRTAQAMYGSLSVAETQKPGTFLSSRRKA